MVDCCGKPETCQKECSLRELLNFLAASTPNSAPAAQAGSVKSTTEAPPSDAFKKAGSTGSTDTDSGLGARGLERTPPTPSLEDYRRGTPEDERDEDKPRTLLDEYRRGRGRDRGGWDLGR